MTTGLSVFTNKQLMHAAYLLLICSPGSFGTSCLQVTNPVCISSRRLNALHSLCCLSPLLNKVFDILVCSLYQPQWLRFNSV